MKVCEPGHCVGNIGWHAQRSVSMNTEREKQEKKKIRFSRDFVIAAVFVLFVFSIPIVTLIQNLFGGVSEPSMEKKDRDTENQGWFLDLRAGIGDFTGGMFLRKDLISFNAGLTSLLSWNTYIQSTQVLLGKEGWLFYKTTNDSHPLWDYMGTHHFSAEELETAARNLTLTRDYLEKEKGIRFVVVTYPNKENVYPEYMPDIVLKVNEESKADQVASYLWEHTDVTYLYPKEYLFAAKSQAELYHHTDTHWNQKGAFVGLQAVFQEVYGVSAGLDTVIFHETGKNYKGDLATIAHLSDRYAADSQYAFEVASADPAQYHDEVLLIVGDSFAAGLEMIAEPYYRKVIRIHIDDFKTEMIAQYNPDILIWENVERNLFRLVELDLLDM